MLKEHTYAGTHLRVIPNDLLSEGHLLQYLGHLCAKGQCYGLTPTHSIDEPYKGFSINKDFDTERMSISNLEIFTKAGTQLNIVYLYRHDMLVAIIDTDDGSSGLILDVFDQFENLSEDFIEYIKNN